MGRKQTFQGLLDTGSELMLVPEDHKKPCGPPGKVGTYGGQMMSGGVLAEVQLIFLSLDPSGKFLW